jgi:hypothetical protein
LFEAETVRTLGMRVLLWRNGLDQKKRGKSRGSFKGVIRCLTKLSTFRELTE